LSFRDYRNLFSLSSRTENVFNGISETKTAESHRLLDGVLILGDVVLRERLAWGYSSVNV